MKSDVIKLYNISFSYLGRRDSVIQDFNFEIPMGSRTALLGLNGTGKTTLLMLLLGFITPLVGKIIIKKGKQENSIAELKGSVGFLSQNENIPFDYTVQEFVMLGRAPHILKFNIPSENDFSVSRRIIESLELTALANCKLGEISGGELQRVRIARTLAQEPEIILMDEPMTHLDLKNKKYLNNLIASLKTDGKTIIYSTHDPLDVFNNSDLCIIMGKKNKYMAGETKKIFHSKTLSDFFEIPITVSNQNNNKSIIIH